MLQRLYDIFYQFKEYVYLVCLIIISLVLMALNDNTQIKQIRSLATVLFGVVQERLSFIPSYFSLKSENELLRQINIELSDEALRLREAKLENMRLRQMLELKEEANYKLVAAHIVNKNLLLLRNTITLDIGNKDGIQPQMPVISEVGLVGVVTSVTENYSVVNILLNTDFRASAKVQRSRVDGIVAWDGKSLLLRNVPKTRDVKVGDLVLTSEYSYLFPPNIRIGIVSNVVDRENILFKSITITPAVDFVKLEEVFVMMHTPNPELAKLGQRTEQPQVR